MTGFMSIHGTLLWASILTLLYIAYRAVLPKPLPKIPYNHDAAGKLLGDVPEMMSYVKRTKRIFCLLTSVTDRHNSPIVQVFIKPLSHPWVVITDPFESQDILLRRSREFDRARRSPVGRAYPHSFKESQFIKCNKSLDIWEQFHRG